MSIDELRKRVTLCIITALECREHYLSKLQHSGDAGEGGSKALEPLRQNSSPLRHDRGDGRQHVRRSRNIKLVSVTGSATKGFDKVIRNSCSCRGCDGTNTEAVAGVIAR